MNVLFFGTPEFAVGCLKKIVESNHTVVGVVTVPDKEAGRGRKLKSSAVKEFAVQNSIEVLQPTNLKSDDFNNNLRKLNADIFVVVAFRMLPKRVWNLPPKGTFNLHASLLPEYRGAAPINWAIINGEKKTGVTTFFINEQIDTGSLLLQKSVEITAKETASSLHDKLMDLGSNLIVETLNGIEKDSLEAKPQDLNAEFKEAPKIKKSDCKISWNNSLETVDRLIRGFSFYPGAWTNIQLDEEENTLKIFNGEFSHQNHNYTIGTVLAENKEIKIAVPDGFYIPKLVQLSGKRRMAIHDFLNGIRKYERITVF